MTLVKPEQQIKEEHIPLVPAEEQGGVGVGVGVPVGFGVAVGLGVGVRVGIGVGVGVGMGVGHILQQDLPGVQEPVP
jgi:hypothetical protein